MTSVLIAFTAGVLSFLAPCGTFLLPGFFAYSFRRRSALVAATWWFLLGFLAIFLPVGLGVRALAVPLSLHREGLSWIGGGFMLVLAAIALSGKSLRLPRPVLPISRRGKGDALSILMLGAVFGFTVAGCTAPLLALALAFATLSKSLPAAILLLIAYAFGLVFPLFLLAAAADRGRWIERLALTGRTVDMKVAGRRHVVPLTNLVAAAMLAAVGIVFIATQGTFALGTLAAYPWLLDFNADAARFLSGFH